jgi:hypothetical protein
VGVGQIYYRNASEGVDLIPIEYEWI